MRSKGEFLLRKAQETEACNGEKVKFHGLVWISKGKKNEYISCIKGFSSTKPKTLFGWGKHHVSTIPSHIWADKRLEIKQGGHLSKTWTWSTCKHPNPSALSSISYPRCFFWLPQSLRALLGPLLWPSTPSNSMARDTQGAEEMAADTAHQPVTAGRGFKSKWGIWLWFYLKMHPALPQTCQYLVGAYQNQNGLLWSDCWWSGTPEEKSLWWPCSCLAAWQNKFPIDVCSFVYLLSYDTNGKFALNTHCCK